MCGIDGYVGERDAAPIVLEGLARLEYRGYDSVGLAVLDDKGGITINKRAGKIADLSSEIGGQWPAGKQAIGHTRWATHGKPSDANAHPHSDCTGRVVVIHDGIVENHGELRRSLAGDHSYHSETDTEVIPHLIENWLANGANLTEAVTKTMQQLEGAQAVLAMSAAEPGLIVGARAGNAGGIVMGKGGGGNPFASVWAASHRNNSGVPFCEVAPWGMNRRRAVACGRVVVLLGGQRFEMTRPDPGHPKEPSPPVKSVAKSSGAGSAHT